MDLSNKEVVSIDNNCRYDKSLMLIVTPSIHTFNLPHRYWILDLVNEKIYYRKIYGKLINYDLDSFRNR